MGTNIRCRAAYGDSVSPFVQEVLVKLDPSANELGPKNVLNKMEGHDEGRGFLNFFFLSFGAMLPTQLQRQLCPEPFDAHGSTYIEQLWSQLSGVVFVDFLFCFLAVLA